MYYICCVLESKSFDTPSTFFLKFDFADHSNGLVVSSSDASAYFVITKIIFKHSPKNIWHQSQYDGGGTKGILA